MLVLELQMLKMVSLDLMIVLLQMPLLEEKIMVLTQMVVVDGHMFLMQLYQTVLLVAQKVSLILKVSTINLVTLTQVV